MPTGGCYAVKGEADREEAIYDRRLTELEEAVQRSGNLVDELVKSLLFKVDKDEKTPTVDRGPCVTVEDSLSMLTDVIQENNDLLAKMVDRAQKYFYHQKAF